MADVIQAVDLMRNKLREGKQADALTVLNTHDERVAYKYGTLYLLAADEGNREQARYYYRKYRRLLRRLNYGA